MEQHTMQIGSREYHIAAYVTTKETGTVPVVDTQMMDDYTWNLNALRSRVESPELYRNVLGEDVEATISKLRKILAAYGVRGEVTA